MTYISLDDRGGFIPLDQCEDGAVYRIHSRNLAVGVFVKERGGFIGIRTKWGQRFLFCEYHWDTGAPHGTVKPLEKLEVKIPEGIQLTEYTGTIDEKTGRPVDFDRPIVDGGRGWYFTDTNEASDKIRGVLVPNDALFGFLDGVK